MKEVDDPRPGPGQLVVEPRFASICGTDHHIFHGEFPRALALLAEGRFPSDLYVSRRMGLSEVPAAFDLLDSARDDIIKIVLDITG